MLLNNIFRLNLLRKIKIKLKSPKKVIFNSENLNMRGKGQQVRSNNPGGRGSRHENVLTHFSPIFHSFLSFCLLFRSKMDAAEKSEFQKVAL